MENEFIHLYFNTCVVRSGMLTIKTAFPLKERKKEIIFLLTKWRNIPLHLYDSIPKSTEVSAVLFGDKIKL